MPSSRTYDPTPSACKANRPTLMMLGREFRALATILSEDVEGLRDILPFLWGNQPCTDITARALGVETDVRRCVERTISTCSEPRLRAEWLVVATGTFRFA